MVEVDDDILAVFTFMQGEQGQMENLSMAKNANITRNFIDIIFNKLQNEIKNIEGSTNMENTIGSFKWRIYETDKIRILIIHETDCAIIVLIKSNTSLSETVDDILGYFYES